MLLRILLAALGGTALGARTPLQWRYHSDPDSPPRAGPVASLGGGNVVALSEEPGALGTWTIDLGSGALGATLRPQWCCSLNSLRNWCRRAI